MARPPGQPIGERVAVVEQKIDAMHEQFKAHERHINDKLDRILDGQRIGQEDRADMRVKMKTLSAEVAAMKPHIKTVQDGKTLTRGLMVLGGFAAAVGAAVATAWAYAKPYIMMQFGRH